MIFWSLTSVINFGQQQQLLFPNLKPIPLIFETFKDCLVFQLIVLVFDDHERSEFEFEQELGFNFIYLFVKFLDNVESF